MLDKPKTVSGCASVAILDMPKVVFEQMTTMVRRIQGCISLWATHVFPDTETGQLYYIFEIRLTSGPDDGTLLVFEIKKSEINDNTAMALDLKHELLLHPMIRKLYDSKRVDFIRLEF